MTDLITRQELAEQIPCALSVIDEARASGRLAYIQLRPGARYSSGRSTSTHGLPAAHTQHDR